jgi:hypothetical protein
MAPALHAPHNSLCVVAPQEAAAPPQSGAPPLFCPRVHHPCCQPSQHAPGLQASSNLDSFHILVPRQLCAPGPGCQPQGYASLAPLPRRCPGHPPWAPLHACPQGPSKQQQFTVILPLIATKPVLCCLHCESAAAAVQSC